MGNAIIYSNSNNNNKKKNDNYNHDNQWRSEESLDRYAIVRYFIEAGFNIEMFNRKRCQVYHLFLLSSHSPIPLYPMICEQFYWQWLVQGYLISILIQQSVLSVRICNQLLLYYLLLDYSNAKHHRVIWEQRHWDGSLIHFR